MPLKRETVPKKTRVGKGAESRGPSPPRGNRYLVPQIFAAEYRDGRERAFQIGIVVGVLVSSGFWGGLYWLSRGGLCLICTWLRDQVVSWSQET